MATNVVIFALVTFWDVASTVYAVTAAALAVVKLPVLAVFGPILKLSAYPPVI